jgi:hypothetical protein
MQTSAELSQTLAHSSQPLLNLCDPLVCSLFGLMVLLNETRLTFLVGQQLMCSHGT